MASRNDASIADKLTPAQLAQGFADAAHGFATTFTVALVLIILTMIPALLLPRRQVAGRAADAAGKHAPAPVPVR